MNRRNTLTILAVLVLPLLALPVAARPDGSGATPQLSTVDTRGKASAPTSLDVAALVTVSRAEGDGAWSLDVDDDLGHASGTTGTSHVERSDNAAISLVKTVGVDPMTCAVTDEIKLPPGGGPVTYCYTVANTGDVMFFDHALTDSELGVILNGVPYLLVPGASVFVTRTAPIITNTVNVATWTSYDAVVSAAWATDVATVTIQAPNAAISLVETVGDDPGTCAVTDEITLPPGGGPVTYCYTVANTGDVTFFFHTLTDSELGLIVNDFPHMLSPGASAFITQTVLIATNTVNVATWTAYNPHGPTIQATDVASVRILPADQQVFFPVVVRTQ